MKFQNPCDATQLESSLSKSSLTVCDGVFPISSSFLSIFFLKNQNEMNNKLKLLLISSTITVGMFIYMSSLTSKVDCIVVDSKIWTNPAEVIEILRRPCSTSNPLILGRALDFIFAVVFATTVGSIVALSGVNESLSLILGSSMAFLDISENTVQSVLLWFVMNNPKEFDSNLITLASISSIITMIKWFSLFACLFAITTSLFLKLMKFLIGGNNKGKKKQQ